MSVVNRLRRNDPHVERIQIALRNETSDLDVARALEGNPFIKEVELFLSGLHGNSDWPQLMRVVATLGNLEQVKVEDGLHPLPSLVRDLFQAIQQNIAIRVVLLNRIRLPAEIAAFVDGATSITSLRFCECEIEEQAARDLAAALQRNTNIRVLEISGGQQFRVILQGLETNSSVRTLRIRTRNRREFSPVVATLLERNTSIRRLELMYSNFGDEFRPVAQSIINSGAVTELKVHYCLFLGEASSNQFSNVLQTKQNLTSLTLSHCWFSKAGHLESRGYESIIAALAQPYSPLRSLEIDAGTAGIVASFSLLVAILRAIQKSNLERFTIGTISSAADLHNFVRSVPEMKVKELKTEVRVRQEEIENFRLDFLQALKQNFTIRSVSVSVYQDLRAEPFDLFESAQDQQRLAFYANRNERTEEWVENPEVLEDRNLWPDALDLAKKAGINSLFTGLRSVLGGDYVNAVVSRKRGRKRKRS